MREIFENMLTELIHKYGFEAKEVIRFATEMEKAKTYEDALEVSLLHLELMEQEI